jgi:chromosome segregation ATPase
MAMAEGAVERRLAQMDREIEELQPELKAARSAWAEARTPEDKATAKEIYEKIEAKEDKLLAERRDLEAKLQGERPCTCSRSWPGCLACSAANEHSRRARGAMGRSWERLHG